MGSGPSPPSSRVSSPKYPSVSGSSTTTTAMMIASKRPSCDPAQRGAPCIDTYTCPPTNNVIQLHVYNMIRMALLGDIGGGGLNPTLHVSLVVHLLRK